MTLTNEQARRVERLIYPENDEDEDLDGEWSDGRGWKWKKIHREFGIVEAIRVGLDPRTVEPDECGYRFAMLAERWAVRRGLISKWDRRTLDGDDWRGA